jgi:hypothetical protein
LDCRLDQPAGISMRSAFPHKRSSP